MIKSIDTCAAIILLIRFECMCEQCVKASCLFQDEVLIAFLHHDKRCPDSHPVKIRWAVLREALKKRPSFSSNSDAAMSK